MSPKFVRHEDRAAFRVYLFRQTNLNDNFTKVGVSKGSNEVRDIFEVIITNLIEVLDLLSTATTLQRNKNP